jgi:hypothetical protein
MECFGTTDFDNNSRLITLSAIITSGLHCMYIGVHVSTRYCSPVKETWIFSRDFRKILKCQIALKSVQWEPSCSMRTDGRTDGPEEERTDMMKLIIAFRNFAKKTLNSNIGKAKLYRLKTCAGTKVTWLQNSRKTQ